jgi:A/G-specific adenine glycosylase
MKLSPRVLTSFQETILGHYRKYGRRFQWRETRDPYAILVAEVMLQQTQAERVTPLFKSFLKTFPTVRALARAPLKEVLLGWQGLGYNRRALNLKRAAEMILRDYDGKIPRNIEKLDALPGIGPYTARAVAAFAFGAVSPFIETNIRTVFLHFFFPKRKSVRDEEILELVKRTLPQGQQGSTLNREKGRALLGLLPNDKIDNFATQE